MAESTAPVVDPKGLSDDQIAKFAEAFGIEEADAKARRDKVLEKFSEFAGAGESTPPAPKPEPTDPPTPTEPAAPSATDTVTKEQFSALAEEIESMKKSTQTARIKANVDAAIKTGRITPAERDHWVSFGEKDPEFAVEALVKLPVRPELLTAFGDDGDGSAETRGKAIEAQYASFAAQTGVPVIATAPRREAS